MPSFRRTVKQYRGAGACAKPRRSRPCPGVLHRLLVEETRTGRVKFNIYGGGGGGGYLSLRATCMRTRELAFSPFSLTQKHTHTHCRRGPLST